MNNAEIIIDVGNDFTEINKFEEFENEANVQPVKIKSVKNQVHINSNGSVICKENYEGTIELTIESLFSLLSLPIHLIAATIKAKNVKVVKSGEEGVALLLSNRKSVTASTIIYEFFRSIIKDIEIPNSSFKFTIIISPNLSSYISRVIGNCFNNVSPYEFKVIERQILLLHQNIQPLKIVEPIQCLYVEWGESSLDIALVGKERDMYFSLKSKSFCNLSIHCPKLFQKNIGNSQVAIVFAIRVMMKKILLTILTFLNECGLSVTMIHSLLFITHDPFRKEMYEKDKDMHYFIREELWRFFTRNQVECMEYKKEDLYKGVSSLKSSKMEWKRSMPAVLPRINTLGCPLIQNVDILPITRGCMLETEKECKDFRIPLEFPDRELIDPSELECELKLTNGSYKGIRLYLTCSIDSNRKGTVVLLDIYHNEVLKSISFSV